MTVKMCEYGCGSEAKYQFKNGKWCCSKSHRSCLGVRKEQSKAMMGKNTGPQSDETKKKKSKANMGKNKGKILGSQSDETKKKKSKAMMGKTHSEEHKKKNGEVHKLTIEKINERYPIFSKVEELRYNPRKPNEKEIQVRCKNHNCDNSKEKGSWFTPNKGQVTERIRQVESKEGNGGSYFYCCQHCKDTCMLYNLYKDPFDEKETNLPYTSSEWSETRSRAWERDNGLCRDCGKPGTDVHHIKPVKLEPFLALDIDNLITLCEDCHKKYHKQGLINSTGNLANITCNPESQKFLNQK